MECGMCLNVNCPECAEVECGVCSHKYESHWTTYGGNYSGCAYCNECEGFDEPEGK